MKYVDIDSWSRKDQFWFFKNYENPFFNICSYLDITELYNYKVEKKIAISYAYLYLSLKVANEIEEFRYRINGDKVVVYDRIDAGFIVLKKNENFAFCYFEYVETFALFLQQVEEIISGLDNNDKLEAQDDKENLIHYSVLPWLHFSSVSHPSRNPRTDSIPKIVFGKYKNENGKIMMPISLEVHHSLMDGIHMGKYLTRFQEYLDCCSQFL